jgi:CubicO group peptidase (beta-lactamase class C family)
VTEKDVRDNSCRQAAALLREAVSGKVIPGAVIAAGWGGQMELLESFGWAETVERQRPMTGQTLFDLASLSKVVATLPVVLHLVADGTLPLQGRVSEILPEFAGGGPGSEVVTIEHLLTHTSGLPAERKYWKLGFGPQDLRHKFTAEPLEAPPGTRTQ